MKHLKSYKMFNEGFKDTFGNEYSVKKNEDFYRIFVITTEMRKNNEIAKDCEDVFGKASNWKNYDTEKEAIDVINTLTKPDMDLEGDF